MIHRSIAWLPILVAVFACASNDEVGGRKDDDSNEPVFSGSECEACLVSSCSGELDECESDPECGGYWNCLGKCELNARGGADESCEARCIDAAGKPPGEVRLRASTCLWSGEGASCGACGATAPRDVTGITSQMCPDSTETNACYECEDENCCETYAACAANPECVALKDCVADCGDDNACAVACSDLHPGGVRDWGTRYSCVWLQCGDERCFTPDDGPYVPNPCVDCMRAGCGDLYVACQSDPECYRLWDCVSLCAAGDTACIEGCQAEHPDAVSAFDAVAVCSLHRCAAACQ
jgi:hypothetical protein